MRQHVQTTSKDEQVVKEIWQKEYAEYIESEEDDFAQFLFKKYESVSVIFSEWASKEGWILYEGDGMWHKNSDFNPDVKTGKQLYSLFKQSKT